MAEPTKALPPAEVAVPKTKDELRTLLTRAQAGDRAVLPVVRRMLDDPANVRLLGGDLAEHATNSFVTAMNGTDLGFAEAVRRRLELLRAELLGDSPTPLERVLVERVAACWLQVQDADIRAAQGQAGASFKQAEFLQRRMDAANKRFLAAVRTLALVRRLAVPVLQVNIARRQVNVVAPAAVTAAAG